MKTMKKIVAILAVALMLCSILPLSVFAADTYELASSIEVGDTVVLVCKDKSMELNGISTTSTKYGLGVAYTGAPVGAYALTVEEGYTAGTYSFKCPNGQYLYWTSGNSLNTNATKNANTSWNVSFSGDNAVITNAKDSSRKLQWNASSPRFACYTGSQTAIQLYKLSGGEEPPVTCEHVWVDADCTNAKTCSLCGETEGEALGHDWEIISEEEATCTADGSTTYECAACGEDKVETIPALPHTYVDGVCSVCGEAQPLEVTIETFANTGVLDGTDSISWTNGGFQFTSYKAGSTSAIRTSDADHFRIYAHNKVVVSGLNGELLTKVQFNATSDSYATVLGGCAAEGWVASVDGSVVTFTATAANGAENLTIEDVSAQTRVSSVIITPYVASESDCEHDYVGVETQAPSCTVEGVMTYTCSKCGESYTEAIAVIPHDYGEGVETQAPDCTNAGVKTYTCSVCGDVKTEDIPANGHNYVNDVCGVCGAVKAYKGTITFDADKTQRTEYSTSVQKWENEGLVLTNNKANSTTNVGDYGAPGRFYKNSQIIISFPEMSKLIIDASGINDDYAWEASLDAAGVSYTVADGIYTITFAEAVNSIEMTAANQVRANSITAVVAHEHAYDNAFDTDCNKCGEVRAVVGPVTFGGNSRSDDVSGLAFKFDVAVDGMAANGTTAIYDEATINGYKLIKMGAIVSNAKSELNIEAKYLCDLEPDSASFAVRVINIPEANYGDEITAIPYFVVEIDGVETTIYGEAQVASYNG